MTPVPAASSPVSPPPLSAPGRALVLDRDAAGWTVAGAPVTEWRDVLRLAAALECGATVAVAVPLAPDRLRELCAVAHGRGARIGIVSRDRRGERFLRLPRGAGRGTSPTVKRLVDVVGALVLAALTAPVWLPAALLIPLDSPGPALFAHERVGRDGRRFRVWKFRTMQRDAAPYARSPGEGHPAVTRVGRLLRPSGLDELPQLWNVLRGEMSLVGPRPEMPFVVDCYTALERERLRATPGITGLWQLRGDRARPIHEQLEYDFYYLASQSLVFDARILLGTAAHAFGALGRALGGAARRRLPGHRALGRLAPRAPGGVHD